VELLLWFVDFILHLDKHLTELIADYSFWIYAILFLIVFCETGVVVTPFLPGDSLLFALGALAAVDTTGTLHAEWLWLMLIIAAVLGDAVNYRVGAYIGPRAFSGNIRWLKQDYLLKTRAFYERHGRMTIVLARFVPIIRTFAPFVAGVSQMTWRVFTAYNVGGAIAWVTIFLWGGYLFGNVPIIKNNFGIVTIAIIVISVLPVIYGVLRKDDAPARP
jgi:membrane-associated protein